MARNVNHNAVSIRDFSTRCLSGGFSRNGAGAAGAHLENGKAGAEFDGTFETHAPLASHSRPLVGTIVQSTTFVQRNLGASDGGHAYSRVSNPTIDELESVLGRLEDAPPAVCYSSGLAAETALMLAVLGSGDHVVASQAIYGGTVRLLRDVLSRFDVAVTFVDSSDPSQVAAALQPNSRLVLIETPANPTLLLSDIAAIAEVTRRAGVLLAVDNTFLTPVLQQPLELGADISVYSTTKHIEGHSTAIGGALVTRCAELAEKLRFIRKSTGNIQTPHNAWLTTRGIKTLPLRLRQHSANAQVVAEWLAGRPEVLSVFYPGLDDFPQRDLARRQHLGGHGGILAFELQGGFEAAKRLLAHVQLCTLVEHVGSVETLLTHSASMTHADVPADQRHAVGITDGLLRLSVGLEEVDEIIEDLGRAIELASNPSRRRAPVVGKEQVACV